MPLFAIAAAIVAVIAIVITGLNASALLWFWLGFIALHLAFGAVVIPGRARA